jgi:hypothetical protein
MNTHNTITYATLENNGRLIRRLTYAKIPFGDGE